MNLSSRCQVFAHSDLVGSSAAQWVAEVVTGKPDAVLGLPTGATPLGMYAELVRLHRTGQLDFSRVVSFNLDEYVGLPDQHPASYHSYMHHNFFDLIHQAQDRFHILAGMAQDLSQECQRYEQLIRDCGGLDLVILGIGQDGHIAFNEPPSSFDSRTRVVELDSSTRLANAAYFPPGSDLPRFALTMGIATIMEARMIMLLATGASKAEVLKRALTEKPTSNLPASILQTHPNVTVLCDQAAARLLL
jgi:glucosamine-6-phosphate deaminase